MPALQRRTHPSAWARAALLGAIVLGAAAHAADRTVVTLGTATSGGGFVVYGDAVAATVNEIEPGLSVQPRATRGSAENIPLLEAGRLDIALVQGEAAHEALAGIVRPPADLRILFAMYPTPGMFAVRGDSPYRSIGDLRGRRVAFGARGSGFVILARYVLDGLGLDMDRDFEAIYLERAADGPAMLRDGRVEALWGGGTGWPGFVEVMKTGGRFIVPTAEEAEGIRAKHPFLRRLTVPAGSYPGQGEVVESVGSWSFIMARPTLPDEVAYRLAGALHRGEAALGSRLPQARESTVANTLSAVPDRDLLHPGARRYFEEIGVLGTR